MPVFLKFLGAVGTAAMIWVGGGIVVHGLDVYGLQWIGRIIHSAAESAAHSIPWAAGMVEWTVAAAGSGLFGLLLGAAAIPVIGSCFAPAWKRLKSAVRERN